MVREEKGREREMERNGKGRGKGNGKEEKGKGKKRLYIKEIIPAFLWWGMKSPILFRLAQLQRVQQNGTRAVELRMGLHMRDISLLNSF